MAATVQAFLNMPSHKRQGDQPRDEALRSSSARRRPAVPKNGRVTGCIDLGP